VSGITEDGPAYVAHADCGCTTGIIIDNDPTEVKMTVGDWATEGYVITKMTVAESRKVSWTECPAHVRPR
jgi:hypothetical protein